MTDHEYPYLDKPEQLEYPTETWAAQDMRKCEVFLYAARYAGDGDERERYLERARYFFDTSVRTLEDSPSRALCRPVVLLLSFGCRWAGLSIDDVRAEPMLAPPANVWPPPPGFIPQKALAVRRAGLETACRGPGKRLPHPLGGTGLVAGGMTP